MLSVSPIDLAGLDPWQVEQLRLSADAMRERGALVERWSDLLDNAPEAVILRAAAKLFGSRPPPMCLAQVYASVPHYREVLEFLREHPRRPVIMRGALRVVIWRHGRSSTFSANGFAADLFWRFIRQKRLTALNRAEFDALAEPISDNLQKKYRLSYHFSSETTGSRPMFWRGGDGRFAEVLLNGQLRWVTRSEWENLTRLYTIVRKTDDLDERMRAVRETSRLRGAA